jgi:DNA-binding SARP family transcriptional activator
VQCVRVRWQGTPGWSVTFTGDGPARVEIATLGRFRVLSGGRIVPGLRRQPVRASLLVYLAMEREATRDTLVGMFWPDLPETRARNALSQTLHRLRPEVGNWIRAEGEAVVVVAGVAVDARDFERAVKLGDHAAALELYAGPFLAGWRLLEAHEMQAWIDHQRARLARCHQAAVVARIGELEATGDLAGAVATARDWVEVAPLEEDAQATLIRLLAASGAGSEARRQYRAFSSAMAAEELDISPAVADGLDRILTGVRASTLAAGTSLRPVVLVEPFLNRTGRDELAPMGPMIADRITEGLDRTGMVRITPALDAARSQDQLAGAARSGSESIGCDRMTVGGSYYLVSGDLEARAQVVNQERGEVAGVIEPVRVGPDDIESAVTRTCDRVLGLLAATLETEWTGLPNPPELGCRPPTFEAYRAYSHGVEHFLREDYSRAILELEEASRLDERFARPLLFAAAAHERLGQWDRVVPVLDRLDALADRLSPYEAESLAWHSTRLRGDREEAYRRTTRIWRRYPGTVAHFVAGVAALEHNRPAETLEIYRSLDPTRGWLRHFHLFWEMLTAAHHMLGCHDLELEVARIGRRRFPALVSSVALEVRALAAVGDVRRVVKRLDQARELPPQPGWRWGRLAELAALELRAHGWRREGADSARRAAGWFSQDVGDTRLRAGVCTDLAQSLYLAEKWVDAEALFRELNAAFPENLDFRGRLGVLAARRGDSDAVARVVCELGQVARPFLFGRDSLWRARIAAQQGESALAIDFLRRAFVEGHAHGLGLHTDIDLEPLRPDAGYQELVRPKG